MKKYFLSCLLLLLSFLSFSAPNVTEKVLKEFKTSFPEVKNEIWADYPTFSEVYFETEGMKCRIRYDSDGQIISTRRDYKEKNLSPFLKAKVLEKYKGMQIYGVTELTSPTELTYQIVLENEKGWMTLQASPTGDLRMVENFKKS